MPRRLSTLVVALAALYAPELRAQDLQFANAIERAVRANAARIAWPGFDPIAIPLAIFDGQSTVLFRHPSPPADFARAASDPAAMVMAGRHPAVMANSSADIGARMTATLLADARRVGVSPDGLSAVALHEAFHVFQREWHKGWVGNEGDLLLYPVDDARRLALRRLESDALRRAQASDGPEAAACWARAFAALRGARFSGLDSSFAKYERLTEMNEGLANYVQTLAAGKNAVEFPSAVFPAAAVRLRAYTTGASMALLLDRLAPDWKYSLERDDRQALDMMLDHALAARPMAAKTCAHTNDEQVTARRTAETDSAAIASGRVSRRRAFDERLGWRLEVQSADGSPLWPQGFDPLNVDRVAGGLLHTRYLKLGNAAGSIEVIAEAGADVEALTIAAGAHPLFSGVRQLTVIGFPEPSVRDAEGTLSIDAKGLKLSLRRATMRRDGSSLFVTIAPAK